MGNDKQAAYQTLYQCLETLSRLIAPISPFYADRLYQDLHHDSSVSVHLADFPTVDEAVIDSALEGRMAMAQQLCSLVLMLRHKAKLNVRQPLAKMLVPAIDAAHSTDLAAIAPLVTSEVNVKALEIVRPDNEVFVKRIQPDFKKLGAKFGKSMKQAAEIIKSMDSAAISALEASGTMDVVIDGVTTPVSVDEVKIISEDIPGWLVANEGTLTVALDVTVTPELKNEGMAREIINRVQNIRKDRDYEITDRICLTVAPNEATDAAVRDFGDYIASQVLADSLTVAPVDTTDKDSTVLEIAGNNIDINIHKC